MESAAPPCKHEFVRIYQRKLKGLERRLVSTKAYLPVGFKQADFGHLSEGSYCFCTKCRARLYPKRTNAEKAQTRLANQAKAALVGLGVEAEESVGSTDAIEELLAQSVAGEGIGEETGEESSDDSSKKSVAISVEELEIVALELEELGETTAEIVEDEEEDI